MSKLKCTIIGGGSLGSYFAIKSSLSGYTTSLMTRNKENKIHINLLSEGRYYYGKVTNSYIDFAKPDVLVLAVKSYNLESTIIEYSSLIENAKHILLLQSNPDLIFNNTLLDSPKVFLCPILFCVVGNYKSIIVELNKGSIVFGSQHPQNEQSISDLNDFLNSITNTHYSKNISLDLFLKIIINSSLLPLSIIGGLNYGMAYATRNRLEYAATIFDECLGLAKILFPEKNTVIFDKLLHNIDSNESLLILSNLIYRYHNVVPSIFFDLIKGKEITEIPYFYDKIILMGENKNINLIKLKNVSKLLNEHIATGNILDEKHLNNMVM